MTTSRDTTIGLLAALAAALIGASWQVATRAGATTGLAPIDLALLRYTVPGVILLPLCWRLGLRPFAARPAALAFVVLGAGLPFGLLAMAGARFAPVAHMGAMLPGAMPLFVALVAAIVLGERYRAARLLGFALIASGIALIGWRVFAQMAGGTGGDTLLGDALFLAAAMVWSVYTVAYRRSGLGPWQAAALVNAASMVLVLPIWIASGTQRLLAAPLADVLTQVAVQGVLAGMLGLWTFTLAVQRVGASRAAASGALVPVLSATGGFLFLGEVPGPAVIAGIAATSLGVALAAGLFDRRS